MFFFRFPQKKEQNLVSLKKQKRFFFNKEKQVG